MLRLVPAACLVAAVSLCASAQASQTTTWSAEDFQTTLEPWLLGDLSNDASAQASQTTTWSAEDFQTTLVPWLLGDLSNDAFACHGKPCAAGVLLANALLATCAECDMVILPAAALSPEGLPENRRLTTGSRVTPGHVHALFGDEGPLEVGKVSKGSLEAYFSEMRRWSAGAGFPQLSRNVQVLVDTSAGSVEVKWRGEGGDGCSSLSSLPEQVVVGGPGQLFGSEGLLVDNMVEASAAAVGLAAAACNGLDRLKYSGGAWDIRGDEQLESGCGKAGGPQVQTAPAYCPSAFASQAAPCFSFRLLHTSEIGGESFPVRIDGRWDSCWDAALGPLSPMAPGCAGGAKTRGQYLQGMRNTHGGNTVIVDAGNHYFGGDFFDSHKGAAEGRFLELQPYDAISVNRHDLVVKWAAELMENFLREYSGPLVMTNVAPNGSKWLPVSERTSKYHVRTLQHGEKVGIVGVMSNELVEKSNVGGDWDMNPNTFDASVFGIDATLMLNTAAGVNDLRMQEEADVVVALLGLSAAEALAVLQNTEGIDVAVLSIVTAGDVARQIYGVVEGFDWNSVHQIAVASKVIPGKRVLVVSTPWKGSHVGNIVIDIDQWGSAVRWSGDAVAMDVAVEAATDAVTDRSAADSIAGAVQKYHEEKNLQYSVVVATMPQEIEYGQLDCWTGDCPISRLVADAVMNYCAGQCNLAFITVGGIRSGLPAGPVALNDIAAVAPFQDQFLVVKLTGSVLKAALRHGASQCTHGGWPQFAGLRLAVPDVAPGTLDELESSTGCLLEYVVAQVCKRGSWTAGGSCSQWEDIKNRQIYSIATSSWLALVGGDGYGDFFLGKEVEGIARGQERPAIRDLLENLQALPTYPTIDQIQSTCSGNSDTEGWDSGCRVVRTSMPPPAPVASDDEGMRFDEATGSFVLCPAGTRSTYDRKICSECSVGRVAPRSGMGSCVECSPGKFQNNTGQEMCMDCPIATFTQESASSQCEECPVGRSGSEQGQRECTACSAGFFQNTPGQSECTPCPEGEITLKRVLVELPGQSLCADCPQGQITSEGTLAHGRYQWVPMEGADNASACGCSQRTRLLNGECVDCGDEDLNGLVCRGKDDVVVAQGFYAEDTSFSVFKCHGHANRCVGGEPGSTCAAGREGTACAECQMGLKEKGDGTCVPCGFGGPGEVNLILFSVCGCIMLFCLYVVVDRGRGTRPSHLVLLLTCTFSMTVTFVQQLGIVSLFEDVKWPDPIQSLLRIMEVLVLDIEVLNVSCVVRLSPAERFAMRVCVLGFAVIALLIAHILLTAIDRKCAFRSQMPALLASIGTIFLALYITVVTAVLAPFQCLPHPNGELSVRAFPSVICWETGEHYTMVAIAALSVQVPLGFYAYCFVTVCNYPKRMSRGDVEFLQIHNWLFFRFKPEVYWYSIVFMTRSLLLAIVPIIPNGTLQILSMDIIMIAQLMLVVGVKPWRLEVINALENSFTLCFLMLLICAAVYVDWVSASVLAWFASVLVVACLVVLPIVAVVILVVWLSGKKRMFDFFLCHHKVGAGAFTRLLKLQLTKVAKCDVFVDADNLVTLDTLFDIVANKTRTLVMVCSKELLQRPWCMGEITTAKAAQIKDFKLALPDFSNPTDEFIDNYADFVGDLAVLTNNGIELSAAQEAIRWFRELRDVCVPVEFDDGSLNDISRCILHSTYTTAASRKQSKESSSGSRGKIKIIADTKSWEACSSAILVSRMLAPYFANEPEYLPSLVLSGDAIPETATQGLLICSAGALEKEQVLQTLAAARRGDLPVVPILVDDGFQFPSKAFVEEHRGLLSRGQSRCSSSEEVDVSLDRIRDIFMTIGIAFPTKMASEKALLTKAQEIADRLKSMIDVDAGISSSSPTSIKRLRDFGNDRINVVDND